MMETITKKKKHPVLRKLITLVIVVIAAWVLGQLFAPALMKALFL